MPDLSHAITEMEVLDTAVKIGLGALISGATTYFITKLNHDKELEKQTIHRKRELLEQIAFGIEKFWNEFRRYYLISLEAIHRAHIHEEEESILLEYDSRKKLVMDATNDLGIAQCNLLLLGEDSLTKHLKNLAVESESYMKASGEVTTNVTVDQLKMIYEHAHEARRLLYTVLSAVYMK